MAANRHRPISELAASEGAKPERDRRARILDAAAKRFAESGFEATTVRQIADDVGVQSGSLYHHFATKDDMLSEIVRATVDRMRDTAARIAATDADAERRLAALIVSDLREMIRDRTVHAILYQERRLFRRVPRFAYVLQAKKDAYLARRTILEDGIAVRLFEPGLDLFYVIHAIVRLLQAAADWLDVETDDAREPPDRDLDRAIDFHLRFILDAVRARDRVREPIPRAAAEAIAGDA